MANKDALITGAKTQFWSCLHWHLHFLPPSFSSQNPRIKFPSRARKSMIVTLLCTHCELILYATVSVEDPSTQEELHCTQSPILKNVTLRGGIKAGNFSDLGDEKNMHMCIALCCERKTCDLAFMIGGTCIAVDCFSEELCQAVKARPTKYDPQIAFIRRRELQRPARKGK